MSTPYKTVRSYTGRTLNFLSPRHPKPLKALLFKMIQAAEWKGWISAAIEGHPVDLGSLVWPQNGARLWKCKPNLSPMKTNVLRAAYNDFLMVDPKPSCEKQLTKPFKSGSACVRLKGYLAARSPKVGNPITSGVMYAESQHYLASIRFPTLWGLVYMDVKIRHKLHRAYRF